MPKADVVIVEGNDLPYHFFYGQVPEHVLTAIDQELSFYPANYERTTAFQKDEWDGRIQLFQQTRSGKSWYYPAGLKKRVAKVLKIFGIKYAVKRAEKREYLPIEVEWKSDFVLRDYQNEAVAAILEANGGIVSLPTGAGKTIIALKIILAMDIPVLILVHTKELLAQWKKEIKTHFGIDCGIVGDGMRKWEPITVAMTQTLASMVRKGDIKTLEYGLLVADECLPYETPVITDAGVLPIGEIVEKRLDVKVLTHTGQFKRILGYQKIPLVKPLVRVTHERGATVCTVDHKILTRRGWVEACELTREDVVFDVCMQDLRSDIPDHTGARRSCEHCTLLGCEWSATGEVVEAIGEDNPRGEAGFVQEGGDHCKCVEVRGSSDGRATAVGSWELDGRYEYSLSEQAKLVSEAHCSSLFRPSRVCAVEILDPEESCRHAATDKAKPGVGVGSYRVSDPVDAVLHSDLRSSESRRCGDVHGGMACRGDGSDCHCRMVSGRRFAGFSEQSATREGVRAHRQHFAWEFQPGTDETDPRLVGAGVGDTCERICVCARESCPKEAGSDNPDPQTRRCGCVSGHSEAICSSVDALQGGEGLCVYDITVEEDHSFVANGMVHSNCHRCPADSTYSVAMRCTARARVGLSATPKRVDNKDLKIFAAVGEITSNITPCDLVRRGYLAKPMLHLHHVPPDSQFFSYGWPKEYDVGIVANDDRNDMIVEDAMHYAANGLQIYIHVERIDHLKILYYRLQKVFEPGQVAYLCGKQPSDDRQEIIKKFKAGEIRVVVGTLLKEGADVPAISCLVNASGLKSDVALVQKVGRALRTADGKDSAIIVDFIDSGKFLRKHSEERYQTYMTIYGDCIDITEE